MTLAEERAPVEFELSARYRAGAGPVLLTGVQAIARMLVEQHAADAREGRTTASFVSGYQGSPLGGLDQTLARATELQENAGLTLVPAVNEELAATAVWGSQSRCPATPQRRRRHRRLVRQGAGRRPRGRPPPPRQHVRRAPVRRRALLAGDDPAASPRPSPASPSARSRATACPCSTPARPRRSCALAATAWRCPARRACWVGMKITADVADGVFALDGTCGDVDDHGARDRLGRPAVELPAVPDARPARVARRRGADVRAALGDGPRVPRRQPGQRRGGRRTRTRGSASWRAGRRSPTSARRWPTSASRPRSRRPRRAGIRLLRLGMVHPVQRGLLRSRRGPADGAGRRGEVGVHRVGRPRALYGLAEPPRSSARGTRTASRWSPGGRADGGRAGRAAAPGAERPPRSSPRRAARPRTVDAARGRAHPPSFCSGCPHNRSTVVPAGAVGGRGIGCHAMVITGRPAAGHLVHADGRRGRAVDRAGALHRRGAHVPEHGDGTFSHSGQLAVQAASPPGPRSPTRSCSTGAVAMTGGQDAAGGLEVPQLRRSCWPRASRGSSCAPTTREHFRGLPRCRTGSTWGPRPARTRPSARSPRRPASPCSSTTSPARRNRAGCASAARSRCAAQRVVINEAVCEGCGDCGVKSNCLSVQPVETELGRKTHIDQSSCNTDYCCLARRLPLVRDRAVPAAARAEAAAGPTRRPLPEVEPSRRGRRTPGGRIGGTGDRHRQPGARHRRVPATASA